MVDNLNFLGQIHVLLAVHLREQVMPLEGDAARRRLVQPDDRAPCCGFAAAAFADQTERLVLVHVERHAVYRLDVRGFALRVALALDGIIDFQVLDFQQLLLFVLEYLHENFHDPITLTQAAEHLGLSQFQLSRICNHQIGMGFNAYLKSLRVTAAMRRLAFTNKGMQEIALGCGFESVRTFNRAFSEETGISPSEYRRAHQQCTALNLDVNPAPAKKSE